MEYKISEVAKLTGITAYTIRYYEKESIIPPIKRNTGGIRVFSEDNLFWIELVTCLKDTKMPIHDIKLIVDLSQKGDYTIKERKVILQKHRRIMETQIKELNKSIEKIDSKIAFYDGDSTYK